MNEFESMDLFAPIKRALAGLDYQTPTPIQAKTIPPAVEGLDILGCAQTGTGKTAAFALPILDYLGNEKPKRQPNRPNVLVLAPTRELAIQIGESFADYGKHVRFRLALVYGGVGQGKQVNALRQGVDVLVATPGRLIDLMEQKHVDLSDVQVFVLDEADRMLDMGFLPALNKIIARLPDERQSLFFSATMPPKIRQLSEKLLFNPVSVNVTPKETSVKQIKQSIRFVQRGEKVNSLRKLLSGKEVDRAIVFARTKRGASGLARKLEQAGILAAVIHGNKSQNARQKALDAFRRDKVKVLVATDVAARGIDIDGVTHVVNYDMPVEPESYVHRVGRTGRAGAAGIAVSFCTPDERDELRAIEKLIGQKIRIENPEAAGQTKPSTSPKSGGRPNPYGNGSGKKRQSTPRNGSNQRFGKSKKASGSRGGKKRRNAPAA